MFKDHTKVLASFLDGNEAIISWLSEFIVSSLAFFECRLVVFVPFLLPLQMYETVLI